MHTASGKGGQLHQKSRLTRETIITYRKTCISGMAKRRLASGVFYITSFFFIFDYMFHWKVEPFIISFFSFLPSIIPAFSFLFFLFSFRFRFGPSLFLLLGVGGPCVPRRMISGFFFLFLGYTCNDVSSSHLFLLISFVFSFGFFFPVTRGGWMDFAVYGSTWARLGHG